MLGYINCITDYFNNDTYSLLSSFYTLEEVRAHADSYNVRRFDDMYGLRFHIGTSLPACLDFPPFVYCHIYILIGDIVFPDLGHKLVSFIFKNGE